MINRLWFSNAPDNDIDRIDRAQLAIGYAMQVFYDKVGKLYKLASKTSIFKSEEGIRLPFKLKSRNKIFKLKST